MKKIILLLILLTTNYFTSFAQKTVVYPSEYGEFEFSLWSKIVLEIKEVDNKKLEYRILSYDEYTTPYSFENRIDLFSLRPKENTIEIYFIGAFYNDGNDDSDWKTVLKIKNNLKKPIKYKADIMYYFNNEFENTSVVGAFPGTETSEVWAHKIDDIILYDFEYMD